MTTRAGLAALFALFGAFSSLLPSARADDGPVAPGGNGQTTPATPPTPSPSHVAVESDRPGTRLVAFDFLGSGLRGGYYQVAPICTAPCAADLVPSGTFRIIGPGLTPSALFQIPPSPEVDLRVHTGSWGASATGMVLTILGAAYVPVGGGLLAGQAAFGDERSPALVPLGGAFLGLGVLALAVGLPLWLGNRTVVTLSEGGEAKMARAAAADAPGPRAEN